MLTFLMPVCEFKNGRLLILGRGNIVLAAEFNFWADPIAAHIVLNSLKCPMTVLTFECGLEESISLSKV